MPKYLFRNNSNTPTALNDLAKSMVAINIQRNQPLSSTNSLANLTFPDVPKHFPYPKAPTGRLLEPDQQAMLNMYVGNIRRLNKIKDDKQKQEKKRLQQLSSTYYRHAVRTGVTFEELREAKHKVDTEVAGRRKKTKRKKRKKRKTRKTRK